MGLFDKIKDSVSDYDDEAEELNAQLVQPSASPTTDTPAMTDPAPGGSTFADDFAGIQLDTDIKAQIAEEKAEKPAPAPKEEHKEPAPKDEEPKPTDKKAVVVESRPSEPNKTQVKPAQPARKPTGGSSKTKILDITYKSGDQNLAKRQLLSRERAMVASLSAQRRLSGAVPIFTTAHLNFKTRVFIDRIEYVGSFGKTMLPIESVAWVKLRAGGTGVIIETIANKKVVMVVKTRDRIKLAETIIKVQELQPKRKAAQKSPTITVNALEKITLGSDELEKLAALRDKGVITDKEFDQKKKQILGL